MTADGSLPACTIVFCGNPGYFPPLAVAATSMAENSPETLLDVHVLTCDHDAAVQARLERTLSRYPNLTLTVHHVPESGLRGLPVRMSGREAPAGIDQYLTKEAYLRIVAPDVLPKHVRRAIYLDCDLVVLDDVARLWRTSIGDATIAAAPDWPLMPYFASSEYREELGFGPEDTYINTGVILVDLERWRDRQTTRRLLDYIGAQEGALPLLDQHAMNAVLRRETAMLDLRWNLPVRMFRIRRHAFPAEYDASVEARRSPAILHYSGADKPWKFRSRTARKRDYLRYLAKTEWRDEMPELQSPARRAEYRADRALAAVGIDYMQALYLLRRLPTKIAEALRGHRIISGAAGGTEATGGFPRA